MVTSPCMLNPGSKKVKVEHLTAQKALYGYGRTDPSRYAQYLLLSIGAMTVEGCWLGSRRSFSRHKIPPSCLLFLGHSHHHISSEAKLLLLLPAHNAPCKFNCAEKQCFIHSYLRTGTHSSHKLAEAPGESPSYPLRPFHRQGTVDLSTGSRSCRLN